MYTHCQLQKGEYSRMKKPIGSVDNGVPSLHKYSTYSSPLNKPTDTARIQSTRVLQGQ